MGVAAAGMGNCPAANNSRLDNAVGLRRKAAIAGTAAAEATVEVAATTDNVTPF